MADRLTIQRFPTGLLPFLGMQTSGDTPQLLAPDLQGTVDLFDFYMRDRIENVQSSALNVTAVGTFTGLVVPSNEMWLVTDIAVQSNVLAAATTARLRLLMLWANRATQIYQGYGDSQALATGESCNLGWHFERPVTMRSGDNVGVWCEQFSGTAFNCFANVRAVKLQI